MILNVNSTGRYIRDNSGVIWAEFPADRYKMWTRYLSVFSSVRVIARIRDEESAPSGWVVASGPGVEFFPIPFYRGPWQYLKKILSVRRSIRQCVDHNGAWCYRIPCSLGFSLALSRGLNKVYAVEVVADPYDYYSNHSIRSIFSPFYRRIFVENLKKIVGNSRFASYVTEHALQRRYPATKAILKTNYSSIELNDSDILSKARNKTEFPVYGQCFKIVHVGAFTHYSKGQDILIKVLSRLKDLGYQVTCDFMGDGDRRMDIIALSKELGVFDIVKFHGNITDRKQYFSNLDQAHLMVMPTRQEGLPRVIIEALARGLPCISTPVGGIPELLPNSCMVAVDDIDGFVKQVIARIDNTEILVSESVEGLNVARRYCASLLNNKRREFYRALMEVS